MSPLPWAGLSSSSRAIVSRSSLDVAAASLALSPASLRGDLESGGTAQNTSLNPGKIGVLPNMASALKKTDITKPSTPTSLRVSIPSSRHIAVSWHASTDNLGFVRYRLYKNNVFFKTLSTTSYTDTLVTIGHKYSYKVLAVDGSGNVSAFSNTVSVYAR